LYFFHSFLFNIFSPLIFLLFQMRCKFVLVRIISCGYKCLVRVIIRIRYDPCSDTIFVFVRDDTQNCSKYNQILFLELFSFVLILFCLRWHTNLFWL
jgi:hypothetical protein